ncbi:MAG: hypothetical protein QM613_04400 [Micrococcaceae bacterium]
MSYLYLKTFPHCESFIFREEIKTNTGEDSWFAFNKNTQNTVRVDLVKTALPYETLKAELQEAYELNATNIHGIELGPKVYYRKNSYYSILRKHIPGNILSEILEKNVADYGRAFHFIELAVPLLVQIHKTGLQHGYLNADSFVFDGEVLHITDLWKGYLFNESGVSPTLDLVSVAKLAWQLATGCVYLPDFGAADFTLATGATKEEAEFLMKILRNKEDNLAYIQWQARRIASKATKERKLIASLQESKTMTLDLVDSQSQICREELPTKDIDRVIETPVDGYNLLRTQKRQFMEIIKKLSALVFSLTSLAFGTALLI